MNKTERWLYFLMEGQAVERFHSRPTLKPVTDAQHQHGVALLCWYLTEGACSMNLIMAALTHDMAEQAASDVSAPTKWKLNISAELSAYEDSILSRHSMLIPLDEAEQRVLHIADVMEGMLSCCRERFYGNKYVVLVYSKWQHLLAAQVLNSTEREVFHAIERIWELANSGYAPMFDVFDEEVGK